MLFFIDLWMTPGFLFVIIVFVMFRSSSLFNHRFNSFKRRRVKNSQRSFLQIAAVGASVLFILFVLGSFALLGVFLYYSKDLPQPGKLVNRERSLSTRIYDRNGKLLYDVHEDQNRTLVRLGDLPEDLVHATLAAEDADFYSHQGFDLIGIARAVYNIAVHRELQGGSTITQQLVRNTLISSERTLTRKIKEFVLALQIERKYSKDEILEMYLNEAPYGGQLYGVEAAAQAYFRKSAKDVNLAQSAFLAGLSQAPSRYSPYGSDPERAENRRKYVLYLMATRGWVGVDGQRHYLEEDRAEQAKDVELTYAPPGGEFKAPHFVMYVKELLGNRFGEDLIARSGLQVRTTLDLEMQQRLQQIVREEVMNAQKYKIGNGALVVIDPRTGELLAMVGSRDFFDENYDGQVNVTLRPRQPGSSIKPITYATAFEQGYTPATVLFDVPTCFPGGAGQQEYCPGNYDGKYRGPLPLRSTLANSINVVAVKLLKLVGVDSMLDTAKKMGISTFDDPSRYGLALTLGGGEVTLLELTNAYSVFAAEGNYRDPQAILKVTDSHDRVLEKFSPSEGRRVLSEETAFLISDILSDNAARTPIFGPWSYLHIPGYSVAVKTG
ncbi:MAG: transglycosylase domain-containing protein, partial [Patescibacteria group bacterium]